MIKNYILIINNKKFVIKFFDFKLFSYLYNSLKIIVVVLIIYLMFIYGSFIFSKIEKDYYSIKLSIVKKELNMYKYLVKKINKKIDKLASNMLPEYYIVASVPQIKSKEDFGVGGGAYITINDKDYSRTLMVYDINYNFLRYLSHKKYEILQNLKQKNFEIETKPSIFPCPKENTHITSGFGWRIHPLYGTYEFHKGLDIAGEVGTPVFATADGIIEKAYYSKSYGNIIIIRHNNKYKTVYAHLHRIFVKEGDVVKRWQKIGEIGNTGISTGAHLHYEVRIYNKQVNPKHFFYSDTLIVD